MIRIYIYSNLVYIAPVKIVVLDVRTLNIDKKHVFLEMIHFKILFYRYLDRVYDYSYTSILY